MLKVKQIEISEEQTGQGMRRNRFKSEQNLLGGGVTRTIDTEDKPKSRKVYVLGASGDIDNLTLEQLR